MLFLILVVPVSSMLKRREFDVEVEYYPSNKDEAPRRSRIVGRQISLPNSFVSAASLSTSGRTKSTSDLTKNGSAMKGNFNFDFYERNITYI